MNLLARVGPFFIGALAAYLMIPSTTPTYTDMIVPVARIIEREAPDRPPTIIERIRFVSVEPRQVATAPLGAQGDVAAFCRPTVLTLTDTVEVAAPEPMLLLRSGKDSPAPIWNPFARGELLLTGPTSLGDLKALDYSVRPGYDFRTSGDSVLVRYPRGAFVSDLVQGVAVLYLMVDGVRHLLGGG